MAGRNAIRFPSHLTMPPWVTAFSHEVKTVASGSTRCFTNDSRLVPMMWTFSSAMTFASVEALLALGALAAAGVDAMLSRRLHVLWADALEVDADAPGLEAPANVLEGFFRPLVDKNLFARTAWVAALLVAASTAAAPPSRAIGTPEPQPRHVSAASFSARLAKVAERYFFVFFPATGVVK